MLSSGVPKEFSSLRNPKCEYSCFVAIGSTMCQGGRLVHCLCALWPYLGYQLTERPRQTASWLRNHAVQSLGGCRGCLLPKWLTRAAWWWQRQTACCAICLATKDLFRATRGRDNPAHAPYWAGNRSAHTISPLVSLGQVTSPCRHSV